MILKLYNTYKTLGSSFCEEVFPTKVVDPKILLWNMKLAEKIGIPDEIRSNPSLQADYFSGNVLIGGTKPIALVYAGHQFGNFVPQLGDGRAHLLGEVKDVNQNYIDIQLKGSGPTQYSRNGDGKCALGPAVREFVMSEAMHALGIPTTRSLAVTTTGEHVYREYSADGAVVTRIASSHIRIGTFQYFSAKQDYAALKKLADYTIARHYPKINNETENKYVLLIESFIEKIIHLITEWMRVGFIHGVMNTDNMTLSGETIDYGPCAMLGVYNPKTVYSSIDQYGRYAFGNQPEIALWNVTRFAETLIPIIGNDPKQAVKSVQPLINNFQEKYELSFYKMMSRKLGLDLLSDTNELFIDQFLNTMKDAALDYTQTFDLLTKSLTEENDLKTSLGEIYQEWIKRIQSQNKPIEEIQVEMRKSNPYVIPRNHHVENIIHFTEEYFESNKVNEFLEVLRSPYKENDKTKLFQDTPEDLDRNYQTFCGT